MVFSLRAMSFGGGRAVGGAILCTHGVRDVCVVCVVVEGLVVAVDWEVLVAWMAMERYGWMGASR